jgi:hypothetical protein
VNPDAFRKPREGDQPLPTLNERPASWGLVIGRLERRRDQLSAGVKDAPPETLHFRVRDCDELLVLMRARDDLGAARYGVRLQSHNGRDAMRDAMEEALDLRVYLENLRMEHPESLEAGMMADEVTYLCLRLVALRRTLSERGDKG